MLCLELASHWVGLLNLSLFPTKLYRTLFSNSLSHHLTVPFILILTQTRRGSAFAAHEFRNEVHTHLHAMHIASFQSFYKQVNFQMQAFVDQRGNADSRL